MQTERVSPQIRKKEKKEKKELSCTESDTGTGVITKPALPEASK